jgi:ribulose-phosphate 3-epimerase
MTEVIPAILAKNFEDLNEKLTHYVNVVSLVQIDVCDGNFVPSVSWPMQVSDEKSISRIMDEQEGLPFWDVLDFEFDLMIRNAHEQFDFFIRLGAKRIVFHFEAEDNKEAFKEFLEGLDLYIKENIQIGLCIDTTTPVEKIRPLISNVDFIQCMGIEKDGFQGQEFDPRVLDQIYILRKEFPELIISVDGSVNENTAEALVKAGANRLVIGSALEESFSLQDSIRFFKSL